GILASMIMNWLNKRK
ncbi:type I toxin-antitoxin system toxin Ldr family protein, partial [Escherichia coli]